MKLLIILALAACVCAAENSKTAKTKTTEDSDIDKRQTPESSSGQKYRTPRRQQEQAAPVQESQVEDKITDTPNQVTYEEQYRPGQVFSVNPQELLELQPERKAPVSPGSHLQQLYASGPQLEKQNLQYFILEPQLSRQVALQPSRAVIARPPSSSDGGEASVGAALSVSDASPSFEQELLSLLGRRVKEEAPRQIYNPIQTAQQISVPQYIQAVQQPAAPQYSQIDRYITKPIKKTKPRAKVQITLPQHAAAPEQYLIETTNVQQQQQETQQHRTLQQQPQQNQYQQQHQYHQQNQLQLQQSQLQQQQGQLQNQQIQLRQQLQQLQQQQYQRPLQIQTVRPAQALRYVQIPQAFYENSEPQGLKIVPAPKLQQPPQIAYRFLQQLPQPDQVSPKQFRVLQQPQIRHEQPRISTPSADRPVTYLKRYQDLEKMRSVKIIEQPAAENYAPQSIQTTGDNYFLRPMYRQEQTGKYEIPHQAVTPTEPSRPEPTKPPTSSIYVNKKFNPDKSYRPTSFRIQTTKTKAVKIEPSIRIEQSASPDDRVRLEQNGRNIDEERSHLPPPKNNKAYTQEEFAALLAAGYPVTPIPIGSSEDLSSIPLFSESIAAQTRLETKAPVRRRAYSKRVHQHLPIRSDLAP